MSLFDQEDDDNKDYLAELTGPGAKFDRTKYSSEMDMYKAIAKGKVFGDRAIEHKNNEFDELREDALKWRNDSTAKAKFEEFFATHAKSSEDDNSGRTLTPANVEPNLDPTQLKQLVASQLAEMKAKEREEANMEEVEKRLTERYGDNARSVLRDKMKTLGFSDEDLKFLAKKSPQAALNALGVDQTSETFQSPPRSSLRSDNFSPNADTRDAIYYEKMRKEQPKLYFSEKMSVQRLKDMESPDFLTRLNQRSRTSL